MKLQFNTFGNEKQKLVCTYWLDNVSSEIAYGGSKGSGKSYLGCSLIFADAFMYPGTSYFIAREQLNDVRKHTIPSIHEVFRHWNLSQDYWKFNGQDNLFILNNGSTVYLLEAKFAPSDPEYYRFGSMQITRGWIEEAGQVDQDAKNNLGASIGRNKNEQYNLHPKLLLTTNPSKNFLYREFYKKFKDGTLEDYKKFVQALPIDNKKLDKGYLDNLERSLSIKQRSRLLLGNWEYDDDPTVLCDYDAICNIFNNDYIRGTNKMFISADLAMQGRDKFIAGVWDGLICTIRLDQAKSSGKSIENDLKLLMIEYRVGRSNVIADSDGMGNYLESYLTGIKEFHGNGKAINSEFANIKSECGYKLAELINNGNIKIICSAEQREKIIEELEQLKAKNIDADEQRKRIISKDDMKAKLGRSPDYLDMLLMRMFFEVNKTRIYGFSV